MRYTKWAFRLLIYVIVINMAIAFLVASYADFGVEVNNLRFTQKILIMTLLQWACLFAGLVMVVLSFLKEKIRNWKFYLSAIGHGFVLLVNLITPFIP